MICITRSYFNLCIFTMFFVGIVVGAILLAGILHVENHVASEYNPGSCTDAVGCHNRKAEMERYFKAAGNPHPALMAAAVLATNRPKLLAAVAVKGERNTPYTVRKGGYKGRHAGSWQVARKYWVGVPTNPIDQALQAEAILNELTSTMPLKKALSVYGGDTTCRYQQRVLAELSRVP